MEKEKPPANTNKGLVEWATTPPQAYAVYFITLILVGGMSFYAGALRPKKAPGFAPPPISAPRN
jgi:hypothetical protein